MRATILMLMMLLLVAFAPPHATAERQSFCFSLGKVVVADAGASTAASPARRLSATTEKRASQVAAQQQESPSAPRRRRIIIDPGHGGRHRGALGKVNGRTVSEEEVTLKVAFQLERLFQADPRFDVKLTRREDVFVSLQERADAASKMNGDLFISLHCNAVADKAAQQRAKGFEIWVWNREGSKSAAAKALERLENDEPGVKTGANARILNTMMLDALESQALVSRRLARAVHARALKHSYLRAHDRGIDAARFKVLEIYDMPSILVEMGFLTHPEEAKLLASTRFQQDWAKILYEGTIAYYEETDPSFPRLVARK